MGVTSARYFCIWNLEFDVKNPAETSKVGIGKRCLTLGEGRNLDWIINHSG